MALPENPNVYDKKKKAISKNKTLSIKKLLLFFPGSVLFALFH